MPPATGGNRAGTGPAGGVYCMQRLGAARPGRLCFAGHPGMLHMPLRLRAPALAVRGALLSGGATLSLALAAAQQEPNPAGIEFFEKRVRPLLAARCYSCHSAASRPLMGGLRLDTREGLLTGGGHGPAIVPGSPETSLLLRALRWDGALKMPPAGRLPDADIAALAQWIRMGAPDPRGTRNPAPRKGALTVEQGRRWWAFQPLRRPPVPLVPGGRPPAGGRSARQIGLDAPRTRPDGPRRNPGLHPVDAFLLARLRGKGLSFSPPADRRTLIRRVTFDLTGLPPTSEEVEAFVNDRSPDAWEKVVDRLLASPHYGERWARHWLDLARFAESHGYEQDYDRPNAYHYRDFLIRAFNQDLPYDTFVRWQLAGDEFDPENPLALMATGFLAAGTHATQITKNQVEKERYDELDDMLSVTTSVFLGLTAGCARCHDHKYDPLSARDYYRALSTFTTTVRSDYDVNMDPEGWRRRRDAFDREHAPLVEARDRYEREILPGRLEEWLLSPASRGPAPWQILEIQEAKSAGGAVFAPLPDGSLLASGPNPDQDTWTLTVRTSLRGITALRLEALTHPALPRGGPGRAPNGNFALTDLKAELLPAGGGAPKPLRLVGARATFQQQGLPVSAALDSDAKSGWAVDPRVGQDHAAVFRLEAPAGAQDGTRLGLTLKFENNPGHAIGRFRLSATTLAEPPDLDAPARPEAVERLLLSVPASARTSAQTAMLLAWFRTQDPGWRDLEARVQEHLARAPQPPVQKVLISSEGVPAVRTHTQGGDFLEHTHFLKRGDPNNKGEVASQSFFTVLMRAPESRWQEPPPPGGRTSFRRRALANWITDTKEGAGALLARVIVNRLWQHHFGRGIVGTPSDFGTQGERPTHPELLDWLASELVNPATDTRRWDGAPTAVSHRASTVPGHWSLKHIHRLIVTSAAYRQSAAPSPTAPRVDPDNRLLWRFRRQRLEAEAIRDAILAVSGLLDPTMFGPGTLDESMKRRSLYFFVKRSRLISSMILFDAPNALTSIGQRPVTTVAPQALLLLNSPWVREAAAAFARRIAPSSDTSLAEAVDAAYRLALARPPTAAERAESVAFVERQAALFRSAGGEHARHYALTDFCHALFALNEFAYAQ